MKQIVHLEDHATLCDGVARLAEIWDVATVPRHGFEVDRGLCPTYDPSVEKCVTLCGGRRYQMVIATEPYRLERAQALHIQP